MGGGDSGVDLRRSLCPPVSPGRDVCLFCVRWDLPVVPPPLLAAGACPVPGQAVGAHCDCAVPVRVRCPPDCGAHGGDHVLDGVAHGVAPVLPPAVQLVCRCAGGHPGHPAPDWVPPLCQRLSVGRDADRVCGHPHHPVCGCLCLHCDPHLFRVSSPPHAPGRPQVPSQGG